MKPVRVIPMLLVRGSGLVKTKQFKDAVYVGDPVNAVRIFSDKEVDELIVVDIDASRLHQEPNYELIAEISGECFMPLAYGGGIRSIEQVKRLIRSGVEKVVINTAATQTLDLITQVAKLYGNQAVVGAIDVRKTFIGGYRIVSHSGTQDTKLKLKEHARQLEQAGVGEILINSVDRDGMMAGYDLDLVQAVAAAVNVPVVACGGAGKIEHLLAAVHDGGASAVAAGSMFVFYGKHKAVLINYPTELSFS